MPVFRSRVLVGRWWQVAPRVAGILVMAGILWWGIRRHWGALALAPLWWPHIDLIKLLLPLSDEPWNLARAIAAVVAVAAAGFFILASALEVLKVDEDGVTLFLGRPRLRLCRIPWSCVRRYELIAHDHDPPAVILHFRLWRPWSVTFGVHARRYADPDGAAGEVLAQLRERGVPGHQWFVPSAAKWVGLASAVVGVVLLVALAFLWRHGMKSWLAIDTPASSISTLPSPALLSGLLLLAVLCFSFAFGCHSAFHRADVRLGLLAVWLAFLSAQDWAVIYGLTLIAIYAILLARLTPLTIGGDDPHLLPLPTWQLAMPAILCFFTPLLAFAAYVFGLYLFRRPGPAWDYTKSESG